MNTVFVLMICALPIYAIIRGADPYAAFVTGAKEALSTVAAILPNLVAMLCAITLLRSSGAIEWFSRLLSPALSLVGIPSELAGLIAIRPFSGSAALAMLSDILKQYGPDSFIGLSASVCVGSTETIFYTIALYCGAAGIKNTRYAIPVALLSGFVGVITGMLFLRILL